MIDRNCISSLEHGAGGGRKSTSGQVTVAFASNRVVEGTNKENKAEEDSPNVAPEGLCETSEELTHIERGTPSKELNKPTHASP